MAPSSKKAILFLGATGGCGLSVLRRSLAAGHTCVALCRTPAKLTEQLGTTGTASNGDLVVVQGNAKDADAVSGALRRPSDPTALVDAVVFTLGGAFSLSRMGNDDPDVCRAGMEALLSALGGHRAGHSGAGRPRLLVISTTGISEQGRDVPLPFLPMYHYMLREPHRDKRAMEELLVPSGEAWTIVRPSFLTDEPAADEGGRSRDIRVGVEDPVGKRLISKQVGYTISREDVGRWMFENLIEETAGSSEWVKKIATITY